jgi:hypothetical protein
MLKLKFTFFTIALNTLFNYKYIVLMANNNAVKTYFVKAFNIEKPHK